MAIIEIARLNLRNSTGKERESRTLLWEDRLSAVCYRIARYGMIRQESAET